VKNPLKGKWGINAIGHFGQSRLVSPKARGHAKGVDRVRLGSAGERHPPGGFLIGAPLDREEEPEGKDADSGFLPVVGRSAVR
jgi:hypothetical protein